MCVGTLAGSDVGRLGEISSDHNPAAVPSAARHPTILLLERPAIGRAANSRAGFQAVEIAAEDDVGNAANRIGTIKRGCAVTPADRTDLDYGYRGSPCAIDLGFDASLGFHRYAIEWFPDQIRWFVDDALLHERGSWDPTPIPHLPMTIHANLWPPGSVELAGAASTQMPLTTASFRNLKVDAITQTFGFDQSVLTLAE